MRFRPCIDIHNGKVKQIVGGSLKDEGNQVSTNFTSELDAAWYARQYQKDHLKGGHIILLNPVGSEYYEATKKQAMGALAAYPGGMQIGGGITADNAQEYLDSGASHVIVTSYVFKDGIFHEERLQKLVAAVGKEHVVLDLSCRRKDGKFYVVTDRWQKFTELALSHEVLNELSKSDHWKIWRDFEKRAAERLILQLEVLLICSEGKSHMQKFVKRFFKA